MNKDNFVYIQYFIVVYLLLFSGYGSIPERLKGHSDDWFIYLFAYLVVSLTHYFMKISMENKYNFKSIKYNLSLSTRKIFVILGFTLTLLGVTDLIWNYIPYRSFGISTFVILICFGSGMQFLFDAFYDPEKQNINFKILKRADIEQELEVKHKYHLDKKLKKRIYFWLFLASLCSIVSGLIHIYKTNSQKEGVFQIILGLFIIAFIVILFEYIERRSRGDDKNNESKTIE